jgi:hypothetical protein
MGLAIHVHNLGPALDPVRAPVRVETQQLVAALCGPGEQKRRGPALVIAPNDHWNRIPLKALQFQGVNLPFEGGVAGQEHPVDHLQGVSRHGKDK